MLAAHPLSYMTERLLFRPYDHQTDFENSLALYGEEKITKLFDHGKPRSKEEVEKLVSDIGIAKFKENPTTGLFTILDKSSGEFIGHFDFIPTKKPGEVEIGYILRYEKQRKGYGSEIAFSIIRQYGLMVYQYQLMHPEHRYGGATLNRFYTTMHPKNIGSIRLSEKMGMKKIGELLRFGGLARYEYAVDIDYSSTEL